MTVIYEKKAKKQLASLPHLAQNRIKHYMKNISKLNNPRLYGKQLSGNLRQFWRYRVGEYRVMCDIKDALKVISVVKIGARQNFYC